MHVSGLYIYPVKSCRGLACDVIRLDDLGFEHDRRFLVVDREGQFLTQRGLPQMARIATQLTSADLILSAPGAGRVSVRLTPASAETGTPRRVSAVVWRDGVEADDCGEESAEWLSAFLGQPARLVRIGNAYRRPVRKSPSDSVAFNDAYPLLAISQSSLDHLNAKLDTPVPMNRFRPNLVIAGAPTPHAEDAWPRVRIGLEVVLRAGGPCGRCVVTTTDQFTGERGVEPLRTLATYRRRAGDPANVDFGQNLIHESKTGTLRIGDPVTPLAEG